MTAEEFRQIALGLPDAVAGAHQRHPDFRVKGKVFATLGYPDARFGMVKLTPEQQEMLVAAEPEIFKPANGAWGRKGSTLGRLERLAHATAASAQRMGWGNLTGGAQRLHAPGELRAVQPIAGEHNFKMRRQLLREFLHARHHIRAAH